MKTTAIVNSVGGAGKTTTCVNLAAMLGERGARVLVIDLDGQGYAARYLGITPDARRSATTIGDALMDSATDASQIALETNSLNVWCIPAAERLDVQFNVLCAGVGGFKTLWKFLRRTTGFDHVFIDTRAGLGNESSMALVAADQAIIPTTVLKIDALAKVLSLIDQLREDERPGLSLGAVVPCNVPPGNHGIVYREGSGSLSADDREWSGLVTPPVRQAAAAAESWVSHLPLNQSHPKADVTNDYRKVLQWLIERKVL